MDNEKYIINEVEKTMELFGNPEQLPSDPYFFTRLEAEINSREKKKSTFSLALNPIMLVLLLVLNFSTVIWFFGSSNSQSESNNRKELLEILAGDLKLESTQNDLFFVE